MTSRHVCSQRPTAKGTCAPIVHRKGAETTEILCGGDHFQLSSFTSDGLAPPPVETEHADLSRPARRTDRVGRRALVFLHDTPVGSVARDRTSGLLASREHGPRRPWSLCAGTGSTFRRFRRGCFHRSAIPRRLWPQHLIGREGLYQRRVCFPGLGTYPDRAEDDARTFSPCLLRGSCSRAGRSAQWP